MTVIYLCKMIISSGIFSIFLKILIFWVHRGVKGQKTVQNDKKLSVALHIAGIIHHNMIVIYGVNVQNDSISRCFFNVKILTFQVVKGLKGQKMAEYVENFCLSYLIFQEPHIIWFFKHYQKIFFKKCEQCFLSKNK